MEELEQIETEETVDTVEETVDDWTPPSQTQDPNAELLRRLSAIESKLTEKVEPTFDDSFTNDISKKVQQDLAPVIDAMMRPGELEQLTNEVGKGLNDEAKEYIRNYFAGQDITAAGLRNLRTSDPKSLELVRFAAKHIDANSKKPAQKKPIAAEGTEQATTHITGDTAQEIDMIARSMMNQGYTFDAAKKILTEEYRKSA